MGALCTRANNKLSGFPRNVNVYVDEHYVRGRDLEVMFLAPPCSETVHSSRQKGLGLEGFSFM